MTILRMIRSTLILLVCCGSYLIVSRLNGNTLSHENSLPQSLKSATPQRQRPSIERAIASLPFNLPYMQNLSTPSELLLRRGVHSIQIERAMALGQLPPLEPNLTRDDNFRPQMRILIVTTWRTGSTFLAELLHSYPGVFYSFEPLHFIDPNQHINNGIQVQQALQLISSIFQCNFLTLSEYLQYFTQSNMTFAWERNKRLWGACQGNIQICADENFVSQFCQYFPIHLIKTVRLRLDYVGSLLKTYDNLRVIWLTRDPRGLFFSRDNLTWCQHPTCRDPATVCDDLWADGKAFNKLQSRYPARTYHMKYEDLSLSPELETKKLFAYLNLPFLPTISTYVRTHTKVHNNTRSRLALQDPYATLRDSKHTVNRWKESLSASRQSQIKKSCQPFMKMVRYV